jgi:hypothetical protein
MPDQQPDTAADTLDELRTKRSELQDRRGRVQKMFYMNIVFALVMPVFVAAMAWPIWDRTAHEAISPAMPLFVLYAVLPIAMFPYMRGRRVSLDEDIQELDFEIDLRQFDVSKTESRAEKILRINSFQLRRYYDLNLQQNIWVFGIGVFCILLGIAVIGFTLYLVLVVADSLDSKIITAVVGSLGSLLTNYIAAIYLKMHASATSNLTSFHARLVETHQLLLGNLLVAQVADDTKRWDTLSQIAMNLSRLREPEA